MICRLFSSKFPKVNLFIKTLCKVIHNLWSDPDFYRPTCFQSAKFIFRKSGNSFAGI